MTETTHEQQENRGRCAAAYDRLGPVNLMDVKRYGSFDPCTIQVSEEKEKTGV